jgi:hypothetical protein
MREEVNIVAPELSNAESCASAVGPVVTWLRVCVSGRSLDRAYRSIELRNRGFMSK